MPILPQFLNKKNWINVLKKTCTVILHLKELYCSFTVYSLICLLVLSTYLFVLSMIVFSVCLSFLSVCLLCLFVLSVCFLWRCVSYICLFVVSDCLSYLFVYLICLFVLFVCSSYLPGLWQIILSFYFIWHSYIHIYLS